MILRVDRAPDRGKFANVRTVFLDRDGVINRKAPEGEYVYLWEQFHVLAGSVEAIAALNASGRKVFVVTNQRGVSLGLYTAADIEQLHRRFADHLAQHHAHVDGFYYCPHGKDACRCRKPGPGLFEQAFAEHPGTSAATSLMIGDSLSDIEAGKRLGMHTIFIEGDAAVRKEGAGIAAALASGRAASLSSAMLMLEPLPAQG